MKKKIIGTVVFLALAAAFLWKLNDIFSLKQEDGILPMEVFYEQEPGSIDVMFYGSSHTYSDINPAVLWEEAGIPSYDLAGSLQPLWNTYYYMKESLKYQRPKVMVVELVRAIEDRDYIEEARTVTNTFGMKFSEEKVENLKASTAEENVADYLLGYPVYHSRYTELSRADFADYGGDPNGSASKGFYPLFVTKPFESMPDMSQVTEIGELSEKSEEYLRKIIALAKEEDIPLVFMISPYQGIIESEQAVFNRCAEIAAEEGVPFLDFNQMYEELGLDPASDFAEASHLNYRGSTKLSAWLASWLKEMYELPDRRGGELYASWDQNAADWNQKYENQLLAEEEGWYDLLQLLPESGDGYYTYVISLNGNYDNGEQPLKETLTEIGVPEVIAEQGGVYIGGADGETVLPAGTDGFCHLEWEHSDLEVTVSPGGMIFLYEGENQIRAADGLNVLVYDHFTESLVTAVGFSAADGYSCVR